MSSRKEGHPLSRSRAWLAAGWHIIALVYVIAVYLVWAAKIEGGFYYLVRGTLLTVAVVMAARLLTMGLERVIARAMQLSDETKQRFPHLEARVNRYASILHGVVRALIVVVSALILLQAWRIDVVHVLSSDLGKKALSSLLTIGAVILVALILWEAATMAMDYRIARASSEQWRAKLKTAVPIIRRILLIALGVIVLLSALSELGMNVTPLLAGAGVLGIAISLGAQNLVKDVLKGIAILMQDSISVGDVVTAGGKSGLVESLTISHVRLRDLGGNVHFVPFSEVSTVVNMTKDYSYALLDVSVSYDTDIDRAMDALTEIGAALQADERFGRSILEPLEILGVDQFADSAIVIRTRIKTRPIKQWEIARAFRRRMKMRFNELGIEIPFPQRTIHFGTLPAPLPSREPGQSADEQGKAV